MASLTIIDCNVHHNFTIRHQCTPHPPVESGGCSMPKSSGLTCPCQLCATPCATTSIVTPCRSFMTKSSVIYKIGKFPFDILRIVDGHLALDLTMNFAILSIWCIRCRGMFAAPVDLLPPPRRWSLHGKDNIASTLSSNSTYWRCCPCKHSAFRTSRVDANQSQRRCLWRSFNKLLGRGCSPSSAIRATDLHRYFDDKVLDVHAATADADQLTFTLAPTGCELQVFCQSRKPT